MKKTLALVFTIVWIAACNNQSKTGAGQPLADSLEKQVMHGHDVGMARMYKIENAQKQAQLLLDSIQKLPAAVQQASSGLKNELEDLLKDLSYADFAMNKWMSEFKYDSGSNDVQLRIKYLGDEKIKVDKMVEAILGSLAKADTVLPKPRN